ncbi:MAG TPA: hypothetical protein VK745_12445 [Polyangiaceae bacterium]|jgi:hypothetical protein|nr:hypothetical protein [Polyangiaceae bacterium]
MPTPTVTPFVSSPWRTWFALAQRSAALGLCLTVATGCARGPNLSVDGLPLRKVVVYRNGVGYFERSGQVDGDSVQFHMRQRMVGDFLATLAIVERGGSSVHAASFPLDVSSDDPTAPDPQFMRMLDAWEHPDQIPDSRTVGRNKLRDVTLRLDGKQHDLAVGYVAATPVWRPSYRIVVQDGGADLQAWGIVENVSGEDWKDVELSLVAGAPLAFESTLGDPVTPPRPVVTDTGEVIAAVPEGVTSLNEKEGGEVNRVTPPPEPAPPPMAEAPAAPMPAPASGSGSGYAHAAPKKARRMKADEASTQLSANAPAEIADNDEDRRVAFDELSRSGLSAPRRISALAAVAVDSGATRYQIPIRLTIPDASATMVLLINQRVPGEAVFLFAPDGGVPDSTAHPFRVARFTNATTGLLERGPIAVFEKGAFLGQGMLDPLPPKATATVPFALERSLAVESERRNLELGARIFKIEAGELVVERDSVTRTVYRIKNGGDASAKLLVRHPRLSAARLYKPPAGTEDNLGAGNALIPIQIPAAGKAELTVEERQPTEQGTDWLSPLADDAVKAYVTDARADRAIASALTSAWAQRNALKQVVDTRDELMRSQAELEKSARETRLSLEAIEKNKQAADLRAKLTARLGDVTGKLDQISKKLVEVNMRASELEVRFRDGIREIRLTTPLPPKD